MNHDLLGIGSTCVDVIIRVDHLPRTEENLHPDSQRFAIGGCAYNVANILGRAGASVTFVTPVGEQGVFGGFAAAQLAKLPFARPVLLPNEANGCCYCLVEANGERTFMSIHGAEYSFSPEWMRFCERGHFQYGYVCGLEVEEKTGGLLVDYMKNAPVETWLYSPGPRGAGIDRARTDAIFALHPILHLSGSEAGALSGRDGLDDALLALHERTQAPIIATVGAQGARVLLDKAATVDDAAALLERYGIVPWYADGDFQIYVTDASGQTLLAQYCDGELYLTHGVEAVTNYFLDEALLPAEEARTGAVRYQRLQEGLAQPLDRASAMDVLRSARSSRYEGKENAGLETVYSVVFDKTAGEIDVCFGEDFETIYTFSASERTLLAP